MFTDPTTLVSRDELFKLARIAQTGCYFHNAVEPYDHVEYTKWSDLRISALTLLYGAENAWYASEILMDNEGNPLTLDEMDSYMVEA